MANKLRHFIVESVKKQKSLESELSSTQTCIVEVDNKNKLFRASLEFHKIKCGYLKGQKKKTEEIVRLEAVLDQFKVAMKAQHVKLIVKYAKQIDKMYWYAYW